MYNEESQEAYPYPEGILAPKRKRNVKDNLTQEKNKLEKRVNEINRALELLEKYPDIQELMDLI